MISKKLLSSKIKKLRKIHKMTQEQLAESIDITPRQLVRLESGKSYPSIETLWKISKIFKIDLSSILESRLENTEENMLKNEINDLLLIVKKDQLELIKKIISAII